MVASLYVLIDFIALNNRDFEVNSSEFNNVVDFDFMVLVLCLELLENIIARPLIPQNQPHCFI